MKYLSRVGIYLASGVIGLTSLVGCGDGRRLFDGPMDLGAEGIQAAGMAGGDIFEKREKGDGVQEKIDFGTKCAKQYFEAMRTIFTIYH